VTKGNGTDVVFLVFLHKSNICLTVCSYHGTDEIFASRTFFIFDWRRFTSKANNLHPSPVLHRGVVVVKPWPTPPPCALPQTQAALQRFRNGLRKQPVHFPRLVPGFRWMPAIGNEKGQSRVLYGQTVSRIWESPVRPYLALCSKSSAPNSAHHAKLAIVNARLVTPTTAVTNTHTGSPARSFSRNSRNTVRHRMILTRNGCAFKRKMCTGQNVNNPTSYENKRKCQSFVM
jgi:hypothetical protein